LLFCHQDRSPPEVEILSPPDGAVLSGTTEVRVVVRDEELAIADITIDNQVVYTNDNLDTIMVYQWDTDQEIEGSHLVIGYARDRSYNEAADTVTITCGKPPYPDSLVATVSVTGIPEVLTATDKHLYAATGDKIEVFDLNDYQKITTIDIPATDLDLSSEYLYSPDGEKAIYRIDINTNTVIGSIGVDCPYQGCLGDTCYYLLSPDPAGFRYSFYIINLNNDSVVYNLKDTFGLTSAITYARTNVYIPEQGQPWIWVFDVEEFSTSTIGTSRSVMAVLSSNSENEIYAATSVDTPGIIIVSTEHNLVTDSIPGVSVEKSHTLALTPDGKYLITSGPNRVWIANTLTRTFIDSIDSSIAPTSVAISPSGDRLFVGSNNYSIYIYAKR